MVLWIIFRIFRKRSTGLCFRAYNWRENNLPRLSSATLTHSTLHETVLIPALWDAWKPLSPLSLPGQKIFR